MRAVPVRLLLVLCLLGSTTQGFIARTHAHARPVAIVSAGVAAEVLDPAGREPPLCVLCDIAGHTPAIAPPAALPIPVLARVTSAPPPSAKTSAVAGLASHHWLGRAPPIP